MKRGIIALLLLVAVSAVAYVAPRAHYRHRGSVVLNDLAVTPGAVLTTDVAAICKPGYSATVRNVPESVKKAVYAEYDAVPKKGTCCEVDHLISLELGGSNDITNLWPQPYLPLSGAHEKDELENYLHRLVCSGHLDLKVAQHNIAHDWYGAYLFMAPQREGQ